MSGAQLVAFILITLFAVGIGLASDRLGAAVQVLPKRGLDEAAIASLRALIASHSRALT